MNREKIEKIMKIEGLSDWKLTITNHVSCCLCGDRRIWIYERQLIIAMFLHEIAHALLPEKERHTVLWADKYTKLVDKYCNFIKIDKGD